VVRCRAATSAGEPWRGYMICSQRPGERAGRDVAARDSGCTCGCGDGCGEAWAEGEASRGRAGDAAAVGLVCSRSHSCRSSGEAGAGEDSGAAAGRASEGGVESAGVRGP
jgi:hypothetical protein